MLRMYLYLPLPMHYIYYTTLPHHPVIWPSISQKKKKHKKKKKTARDSPGTETHPSASMSSTALGGVVKCCCFSDFIIE